MSHPEHTTTPIAAPALIPHAAGLAPAPPLAAVVQRITLHNVEWATYRKISEALSESQVRLTYDRGKLELMTKSSEHESWNVILLLMVAVLTEEMSLRRRSCGGMTCDREDLLRGVEPDNCFYVENEPRVRGRNPINLAVDPPPDLAIEIDVSRDSQGRLPIYAAIGVTEIWRFDLQAMVFYRLRDGAYVVVEQSEIFPFLRSSAILDFLRQWQQTDEVSLIQLFRQWVRQQLAQGT